MSVDSVIYSLEDTGRAAELSISFALQKKITTYERQVYTFFIMLGDIGGFWGAIILVPTSFMSYYSGQMFNASLQSEIPVKKQRKRQKEPQMNQQQTVKERILMGQSIEALQSADLREVYEEVKQTQPFHSSFFKALFYLKFCCKKDRQTRISEKVSERFDEHLDIRSFHSVHSNLAMTLKLIFNKEQLTLFNYQARRAISSLQIEKEDVSGNNSSD